MSEEELKPTETEPVEKVEDEIKEEEMKEDAPKLGEVVVDEKVDDKKKDDDSEDTGKESIESDESSFHASDYENDAGFDPDKETVEMLSKATTLKEEGNEFFKNGDLVRASRAYKKGVSILKPIHKENSDDFEVKALIVTLSNNLSMVCLKQGKPKLSLDVATKAIEVDDTNMKAYYRRAMAHKKLGNFKEAKSDLKEAVKCDSGNNTVKKELHALAKYMSDIAKRQKAAAQAVFSFDNKTSVLYEDKIEEEKRKKDEEERKKQEEEDLLKKRKQDWEDECVKLMAAGKDAITFEVWDKAHKKKEKAERKAKKQEDRAKVEEKKKEDEKQRAARAKAKQEDKVHDDEDDDDKLTESELAQFRGYKKTADGKTTSYFSREQSAHEKHLIGDITPQRLDENGEISGNGPAKLSKAPSTNDVVSSGKGKASAWNAGGTTWEEKNATDWVNTQIQFRLMESISKEAPLIGIIKEVDSLKGEASVAVAGGKKRYIFDYHCNLTFEIRDDEVDELVASGTLRLPDINSTNHDDFDVEVSAWAKPPADEHSEKATECRKELVKAVRVSVLDFVGDFNGHY
jgi:tetratricopeptide (TPR) repeat protein